MFIIIARKLGSTIFVPASSCKMDQPGHISPQIHTESLSCVNLCPVFYLKSYGIQSLLGRSHVDLGCPLCSG